jgi:hypothetical protein
MAMVILGYLICLSLGACLGFVAAGLFIMMSDDKQKSRGLRAGNELPRPRWKPEL